MRSIGVDMVSAAPPEWRQLRLVMEATVESYRHSYEVVGTDGTVDKSRFLAMPSQAERVAALRIGMYEGGKGTWFTMTLTVTDSGEYDASFDYESPPHLGSPLPNRVFESDLRAFPRDPAHIPTWLADTLIEAGKEN
ncbi:hypothetical protein ACFVAV_04520 [Nocardia sp. NPDC057663]|uniref:hypothetical protein n=1 Tax=Nocardia sp. NPDC057663 TaxID=3346201 RepID=UPI00366D868A